MLSIPSQTCCPITIQNHPNAAETGANLIRAGMIASGSHLHSQRKKTFGIIRWLRAYVFDFGLVLRAKTIKPQTILFWIDQLNQLTFNALHRCSISNAFKNRILHALAVIHTMTSNTP